MIRNLCVRAGQVGLFSYRLSSACAILLFYASNGMAQQESSRIPFFSNSDRTFISDAGTVAGYCAPLCPID